jgi:hypothetical protein
MADTPATNAARISPPRNVAHVICCFQASCSSRYTFRARIRRRILAHLSPKGRRNLLYWFRRQTQGQSFHASPRRDRHAILAFHLSSLLASLADKKTFALLREYVQLPSFSSISIYICYTLLCCINFQIKLRV